MVIDFSNPALTYKRLHGGGLGVPIAKACGLKKSYRPIIIDATAGLGEDGFFLASLGCEVKMIERNFDVAEALRMALERALVDLDLKEIASRILLTQGSALDLIPRLGPVDEIGRAHV